MAVLPCGSRSGPSFAIPLTGSAWHPPLWGRGQGEMRDWCKRKPLDPDERGLHGSRGRAEHQGHASNLLPLVEAPRNSTPVAPRASFATSSIRHDLGDVDGNRPIFRLRNTQRKIGAGRGNRTPVASLENWCTATVLYPRRSAPSLVRTRLVSKIMVEP